MISQAVWKWDFTIGTQSWPISFKLMLNGFLELSETIHCFPMDHQGQMYCANVCKQGGIVDASFHY